MRHIVALAVVMMERGENGRAGTKLPKQLFRENLLWPLSVGVALIIERVEIWTYWWELIDGRKECCWGSR